MTRCWLISYDIADGRRLRRVARIMERWGLRVQKSVFECWLEDQQRAKLEGELAQVLDPKRDSVRYYPLCRDCRQHAAKAGTVIQEKRSYYIV